MNNLLAKLRALTWLSYQIEANWTKFYLYLLYIMVRPISTLLLILFIVIAVRPNPDLAYFILVGQAFYNFVGSGIMGVAYPIWDDREHYRSLKHIYISPTPIPIYLIGRGIYKFIEGLLPLLLSFIVGAAILNYPLHTLSPNIFLLALNFFLGIVWIIALGLIIASFLLFTTHYGWAVVEGIIASLLLFGNVIFPSYLLPYPFNVIADYLPIKYWMDLNRVAIKGLGIELVIGDLLILILLTVAYLVLALVLIRVVDKIARNKGLIDITTAH